MDSDCPQRGTLRLLEGLPCGEFASASLPAPAPVRVRVHHGGRGASSAHSQSYSAASSAQAYADRFGEQDGPSGQAQRPCSCGEGVIEGEVADFAGAQRVEDEQGGDGGPGRVGGGEGLADRSEVGRRQGD